MLQFPRACTILLRRFKLPSQHFEYVVYQRFVAALQMPACMILWFDPSVRHPFFERMIKTFNHDISRATQTFLKDQISTAVGVLVCSVVSH